METSAGKIHASLVKRRNDCVPQPVAKKTSREEQPIRSGKLPKEQSTVHKLLLNYLLIVPAAGALALWEGAVWDSSILISAGGSAVFILGYNITVLLAYKQVDANQVTSAEYTGLIWAVLIGWIGFNEMPDLWFAVGSAMIVVPLILVGLRSRDRSHRVFQAHPTTA